MVFQDPMTSLNPLFTVGAQIGEVLRTHLGMSRKQAERARRRAARPRGHPVAARAREGVPARAVRRSCASA